MANHYRLGDSTDPMDQMMTRGYSVDLTRGNKNIGNEAEVVGLKSLNNPTESAEIAESVEKKMQVNVVHDAKMNQNVEKFDPTSIIPKKEKKDEGANEIYAALDLAIEREKASISDRYAKLEEKMYEDFIDNQDNEDDGKYYNSNTSEEAPREVEKETDDEDDFYETSVTEDKSYNFYNNKDAYVDEEEETKPVTIKRSVSDEIEYDEDEMNEDLDDSEAKIEEGRNKQEDEMNDIVEGLKKAAKQTMKPKMSNIDLSKFKIGNKGVKASTVILREEKDPDVADWVMFESGYPISMSALTGPELIKLDPENSNRNRLNTMKDIYKIIYDHVVDSKKVSFDRWMKQTRYADIDDIYFALYMATFNGSNFISYQCPDCKKVFINDVDFKDMIKYKDDDTEKKVREIMQKSTDNGEIEFDVDLVQVSDKYVFGMRSPSLYNIIMETAGLPDNILEKYSDLIDTITYIDSVYTIDYTNMELTPIIIPIVKDDPVKSTVKKIKTMYNILKTLSSDEYYVLRGYISKLNDVSSQISYRVPEAKCPDCDKEIPANEDTSASALLFTRHHLGAFANM